MAESTPEQVIVGKITAAFGIKGWVKIHSYTDPGANIFDFQQLSIIQKMVRDLCMPISIVGNGADFHTRDR